MLIPLLKAIYYQTSTLPKDLSFYQQAIEEIEHFSVSSQMYYLLKQNNLIQQTPSFFQERLHEKFNRALYQNLFIKNQMVKILEQYEKLGIRVIPLKGVLLSEESFGHLGARGTSDIDLLIRMRDLHTAIECVQSLGFNQVEEPIPFHFHLSFSKVLPHSPYPLTVELHWDLLKENTSNLDIQEFWEQSLPYKQYSRVNQLSSYHTLYMLCLHGWRHHLNSIKYFIDILQVTRSLGDQLDYPRLMKDAARHKTLRRVTHTMQIVRQLFPHIQTDYPPLASGRRYWDYNAIRYPHKRSYRQYYQSIQFDFLDYDTLPHAISAWRYWFDDQVRRRKKAIYNVR